MHHGPPHEAASHLASHPNFFAHLQRQLHVGVKVEKTQGAGVGAIIEHRQQLAARFECDIATLDHAFDLRHLAFSDFAQFFDLGFVFVPIGQVQGQVDRSHQTQLSQGFLWC